MNLKNLSFGLLFTCAVPAYAGDIDVYFNHPANAPAVTADLESVITGFIDGASSTVDIAIYDLDNEAIATALKNAQDRGVTVRLITDNENTGGDNQAALDILTNNNVPWLDDTADGSAGSGSQHNKFIVVDGTQVLTGSANFTHSGLHGDPDGNGGYSGTGNANNIITIDSTGLATAYTTQFNVMWGDGPGGLTDSLFGLGKPDHTVQTFYTDNENIQVDIQFAPQSPTTYAGSTLETLNTHISSAQSRVHLAQFVFSAQILADTLETRFGAGVSVEGVGDSSFFNRYYSEFLDMLGSQSPNTNGEYEVDPYTNSPNNPWSSPTEAFVGDVSSHDKLHHKYWVVDNTVVTGSLNASGAGSFANDENMIIIHDTNVADQFEGEFQRRFCEAKGALNCDGSLTHDSIILENVAFTAVEATAVMDVAANATLIELDVDAALDARAANAIFNDRPTTMEDLGTTYYVGKSALKKLRSYAMLPTAQASHEVRFDLGNETDLKDLYSYPNSSNGMTLEQTIEHYLTQRLERDGIALASAVVDKSGSVYETIIRGDSVDINGYATTIPDFLSAGMLAVQAVEDLEADNIWNNSEWRFFLPLGLATENQRSVQLLHFPPDYSLTEQDYLNSSTSQRWETLLTLNAVSEEDASLFETILDIAPIAAPASEGSSLDGTYTYFEPYVLDMLKVLTKSGDLGSDALPIVAYGSPVRTWLSDHYNLTNFGVNSVAEIEIEPGVFAPVIGANHPSYIWYATQTSRELAFDVMEQDLISACWQHAIGDDVTLDPTVQMASCVTQWQANPLDVCIQMEIQAYSKSEAEATSICEAEYP
jgi:phosphatidylserine/phosphatidylglycerophosphate/cardiolipin synthase-like enzyme